MPLARIEGKRKSISDSIMPLREKASKKLYGKPFGQLDENEQRRIDNYLFKIREFE